MASPQVRLEISILREDGTSRDAVYTKDVVMDRVETTDDMMAAIRGASREFWSELSLDMRENPHARYNEARRAMKGVGR